MRRGGGRAALLALAIALLCLGTWQGLAWHRSVDRVHDGSDAVAAADHEVAALLSVSARTSSEDLARLRAGATGDFKSQLSAQSTTFAAALRRSKVSARGTVVSSGLASLSGGRATVVLAATGTVSNTATTGPSSRSYRLRAELTCSGDTWLVSSLEFVS